VKSGSDRDLDGGASCRVGDFSCLRSESVRAQLGGQAANVMSNQNLPLARRAALAASAERGKLSELPFESMGDAALVAALLNGSERAANVIWHRHAPAVRRTLGRSLGPDQEIEDLLQEVFMGFVKSAAKLEDPDNLRSYLVSIAFRRAAMEIRRRKVRRWVTLTSSGEVPDAVARQREPDEARALRALYQVLDTLSARDRLVFVARYIEGMQIDETAKSLKLSKATVWRIGTSTLKDVVTKAQQAPALAAYVECSLKGTKK
jgi:RNA polymerase sigma-70 factor, ECF subfamily